jgi:hypothetical protein
VTPLEDQRCWALWGYSLDTNNYRHNPFHEIRYPTQVAAAVCRASGVFPPISGRPLGTNFDASVGSHQLLDIMTNNVSELSVIKQHRIGWLAGRVQSTAQRQMQKGYEGRIRTPDTSTHQDKRADRPCCGMQCREAWDLQFGPIPPRRVPVFAVQHHIRVSANPY